MKSFTTYNFTTSSINFFLFFIVAFSEFIAFGEEWTVEQKEVWKSIENLTKFINNHNIESIMDFRHNEMMVWWKSRFNPYDKHQEYTLYKKWFEWDPAVKMKCEPVSIKIVDKVAIVTYTYEMHGNKDDDKERRMETWIKSNSKWLLLSSMTASC